MKPKRMIHGTLAAMLCVSTILISGAGCGNSGGNAPQTAAEFLAYYNNSVPENYDLQYSADVDINLLYNGASVNIPVGITQTGKRADNKYYASEEVGKIEDNVTYEFKSDVYSVTNTDKNGIETETVYAGTSWSKSWVEDGKDYPTSDYSDDTSWGIDSDSTRMKVINALLEFDTEDFEDADYGVNTDGNEYLIRVSLANIFDESTLLSLIDLSDIEGFTVTDTDGMVKRLKDAKVIYHFSADDLTITEIDIDRFKYSFIGNFSNNADSRDVNASVTVDITLSLSNYGNIDESSVEIPKESLREATAYGETDDLFKVPVATVTPTTEDDAVVNDTTSGEINVIEPTAEATASADGVTSDGSDSTSATDSTDTNNSVAVDPMTGQPVSE